MYVLPKNKRVVALVQNLCEVKENQIKEKYIFITTLRSKLNIVKIFIIQWISVWLRRHWCLHLFQDLDCSCVPSISVQDSVSKREEV